MHGRPLVVEVAIQSLLDHVDLLLELVNCDSDLNSISILVLSFDNLVNSIFDAFECSF